MVILSVRGHLFSIHAGIQPTVYLRALQPIAITFISFFHSLPSHPYFSFFFFRDIHSFVDKTLTWKIISIRNQDTNSKFGDDDMDDIEINFDILILGEIKDLSWSANQLDLCKRNQNTKARKFNRKL